MHWDGEAIAGGGTAWIWSGQINRGITMAEREIDAEEATPEVKGRDESEEDVESLKKALAEEQAKAEGYLANWQRAQADFINFKRRTEQERSETAKLANTTLILNLLPILDDLERALDNVSESPAGLNWVDGIALIYRKLKAILEGHGLSEIKALGETFDPNLHDAVLYAEGEGGKVIEELQKGYKLHDQVLRPTMVKVGEGKDEKEETSEEEV